MLTEKIKNTYENLQIVQSQFFTDKLIFIYIWSNQISIGLSVFGFIARHTDIQRIQMKSYSVTFSYL